MQAGMIGVGRMGGNMARRLAGDGHMLVAHDRDTVAMRELANVGARTADDLASLVAMLPAPRTIWLMVPAAVVAETLDALTPLLSAGDTVVDGGNSHYRDAIRRARWLSEHDIAFVDVGVSGGIWGGERGYCLMIGGEGDAAARIEPLCRTLATGTDGTSAGGAATAGYLHCGPAGAGHFVKMVHNGIEYGLMAAYAEGFELLRHADAGRRERRQDAETAPLTDTEAFAYDLDIPRIAELWRHGTVITSWLLDMTAAALEEDPDLTDFSPRVSDSGEGRWAVQAALESGSPASVLALSVFQRFSSRDEAAFGNRLLSAMRRGFGGHESM